MFKYASTFVVTALLAGCASSGLPSNATTSSSSTAAGSSQLGVTGDGGALSTAGVDVVSPVVGEGGLLGSTLGGGSDGSAGKVASGMPDTPVDSAPIPTDGLAALDGPTTQLADAAPSLGVSGSGGLGEDLFGYDVTGAVIGTDGGLVPTLLGGGDSGPAGGVLPSGDAPLRPVGEVFASVIEGAQTNQNSGSVNALSPVVQPVLLGSATGDGASAVPTDQVVPALVPVLALVIQAETTELPGGQTAGDILVPVVFGTGLGVAGNVLPLDTIASAPVPQTP